MEMSTTLASRYVSTDARQPAAIVPRTATPASSGATPFTLRAARTTPHRTPGPPPARRPARPPVRPERRARAVILPAREGVMNESRRQWLKGSGLALLGSGFLSRVDRVAAAQPSSLRSQLAAEAKAGTSAKQLLSPQAGEEGPPEPAKTDRLPLDWNRAVVKRFKEELAKQDIQAFLARDPLNIIYLTGYWHTETERPQAVFMNADDADPWFLYPALDRDLVTSWWFGGGRMYFDFLHGEDAFPHEGKVQMGETVDLFKFLMEGIKQKGVQGSRIGLDGELYPSQIEKAKSVLRGVEFVDVSDVLKKMRMVKTAEELALWRRAYVYMDRAHAFARDYILTHGRDVTDYEVSMATMLWINDALYSDLDLAGGKPHHGVGAKDR